jgi:excinuclease ABC subunit A
MLKSTGSVIRLRGVRHNNLKNFDLELPLKQLIVITGLSGSGKSSLAFDTLFAEGQRRYIETFSPYARQFFDRMDKPQVDSIEGIPPAIAIEQRNAVRTTRSTVGTMTEICDYMKMVWPHMSQLHCRHCQEPVRKDSPDAIWNVLFGRDTGSGKEFLVTFNLPLSAKLSLAESLALIAKQGYQRLLLGNQIFRLDEVLTGLTPAPKSTVELTVIQDRVRLTDLTRHRFVEACEQAYHFGKGKLAIYELPFSSEPNQNVHRFSRHLHCARCDIEYKEPSPALFSFNSPVGACPACRGFGRIISIDYNRALPDHSKTLAGGVVKPWQTGHGLESQRDLIRMCRHYEIPVDVPFEKLRKKWQDFVIDGEPDYGKDEEHQWPAAWYGVKGYFRWLESKAYKMHVRVLLSRYRAYTTCPDCRGKRFQPESLLYHIKLPAAERVELRTTSSETALKDVNIGPVPLTLADFYQLPIKESLEFLNIYAQSRGKLANDPIKLALDEVRSRLTYLEQVGLGYLTLERPTRSLSGGETERVNLTTCLGTRLVNTLFVLDEPSVGLHPRDTGRLVNVLEQLRSAGNTVVVVEHEASVMRAADQIVDLGPGHGASGGEVVFQGSYQAILRDKESLTGQYLSGRKEIEIPQRRPVYPRESVSGSVPYPPPRPESALMLNDAKAGLTQRKEFSVFLHIRHATRYNLRDVSMEIPLERLVCITGVSGSGKTTLVREILLPALQNKLKDASGVTKASDRFLTEEDDDSSPNPTVCASPVSVDGSEYLKKVVPVDQSILGKTPRSNPAVYIGAFDYIRTFFAQSEQAQQRGLNASAFSFNSSQGQCERCRGAGYEKIEMQFLSDVFVRCSECNGRRFRSHILEVRIKPGASNPSPVSVNTPSKRTRSKGSVPGNTGYSIADLLESTVEQAIGFLSSFQRSSSAIRAVESLRLLAEVGLGYLKLGQPLNTLSGGESQRLKLVRHLADSQVAREGAGLDGLQCSGKETGSLRGHAPPETPTLFLFDEPTTGLHFDDVRVLLKVFQRLVQAGHSVLVVEHNLDVIKSADWVIDLGPEGGEQGGQVVAEGTPEQIASCQRSHTGHALRSVLPGNKAQTSSLAD